MAVEGRGEGRSLAGWRHKPWRSIPAFMRLCVCVCVCVCVCACVLVKNDVNSHRHSQWVANWGHVTLTRLNTVTSQARKWIVDTASIKAGFLKILSYFFSFFAAVAVIVDHPTPSPPTPLFQLCFVIICRAYLIIFWQFKEPGYWGVKAHWLFIERERERDGSALWRQLTEYFTLLGELGDEVEHVLRFHHLSAGKTEKWLPDSKFADCNAACRHHSHARAWINEWVDNGR